MTTPRAASAVAGSRTDDPARPRVLLIEDEPRISSFVARALSADGYDVDVTATGADGLRRAIATPYRLVLLDLVIPDLDGRVVLERLLAVRPSQAVIVVSCLSEIGRASGRERWVVSVSGVSCTRKK